MTTFPNGSRFRVERSILVDAPPERLFAFVYDFHRWRDWSPYEELDPDLQRGYAGEPSGKGAVYTWQGNGKAGAGRMEIVEAVAPSRIAIDLQFSKPMRASHVAEFSFVSEGGMTRVTWAMEGAKSLVFRIMGLVMNMDRTIGRDFEKGLATMKAKAETAAA